MKAYYSQLVLGLIYISAAKKAMENIASISMCTISSGQIASLHGKLTDRRKRRPVLDTRDDILPFNVHLLMCVKYSSEKIFNV